MNQEELKEYLDSKVDRYNSIDFIENDPISIPHRFTRQEDIEISAFWVAMLSWGQRVTIINKSNELMALMDDSPYDFIMNHKEKDLKPFLNFKHRTFQPDDTLYFISFFRRFYEQYNSLESAFFPDHVQSVEESLSHFHNTFFNSPLALQRTRKHVSTPIRKSSCKRLNMFLRWMVRKDDRGVDFGIWDRCDTKELKIPLDVHVFKVAHQLGLLTRDKTDWPAVIELTNNLLKFDPVDPVKYDYALFSIGIDQRAQGSTFL